jgi:hypothetical protein
VHRLCDAKRLKLSSDGDESGCKKCKQGCGGAYDIIWRSLRLVGVWSLESGSRICVAAFDSNLVSVAMKMVSNLICFFEKLHTFSAFNAIFIYNAAIIVLPLNTKKVHSRQL